MMSRSESVSCFFHINFSQSVLTEFSSSFVPDVVAIAWLSFMFVELERRTNFIVDFILTECFEFTIETYLNY